MPSARPGPCAHRPSGVLIFLALAWPRGVCTPKNGILHFTFGHSRRTEMSKKWPHPFHPVVFSQNLCAGRATPCLYTKKWASPFHRRMFLHTGFPCQKGSFPPNVTRTSLLSPKYMGSSLPLIPSKKFLQSTLPCTGG